MRKSHVTLGESQNLSRIQPRLSIWLMRDYYIQRNVGVVQLQFLKISGQCSSSFWRSAASAAPVSEYQRPVQLCSNSWRSVPLFLDEHYPTRRAWVDTQVAEHNTSAWSVADHCTSYLAVQIKQRYKHRAAQEEKLRISLRQEGHVTDLIVNCGSF